MGAWTMNCMLLLSVLGGMCSANLIVVVLWMEITLFIFIFMTFLYKMMHYSSPNIKYFLVQTVGSMLLLLYSVAKLMVLKDWNLIEMMLFLGLSLKIGVFPMHFWVIPVMTEIPYFMVGILGVPMKILPLCVLYDASSLKFLSNFWLLLMLCSLGSMLVGVFLGIKNKTLRGILGASSITHTGWFLFAILGSDIIMYFLMYSLTLFSLLYSLSFNENTMISLGLYALSGLPPFGLFFGKLLVLLGIIKMSVPMMFVLLALLSAVLSLFYYLKFSLFFFLNYKNNTTSLMSSIVFFFTLKLLVNM